MKKSICFESTDTKEDQLDKLILKQSFHTKKDNQRSAPVSKSKKIPELDLHGLQSAEAIQALERFVTKIRKQEYKKIGIITGKGKNSPNSEPILKKLVLEWINEQNGLIKSVKHAPLKAGGSGVLVITLN